MARKLRFERAGSLYPVLNRQFPIRCASEGARHAFLRSPAEAFARTGWVVHAWQSLDASPVSAPPLSISD